MVATTTSPKPNLNTEYRWTTAESHPDMHARDDNIRLIGFQISLDTDIYAGDYYALSCRPHFIIDTYHIIMPNEHLKSSQSNSLPCQFQISKWNGKNKRFRLWIVEIKNYVKLIHSKWNTPRDGRARAVVPATPDQAQADINEQQMEN